MGVFVINRGKHRLRKVLEGCSPRLHRMALAWTRDPELAKDLVRDVVGRALKGAQPPLGQEALLLCLFRMLSDCWYERLRRDHPAVPRDELVLLDGCDLISTDWQRYVVGRVQAEIARLPVGQRQTVTLADIEGLSYAEIAEVLEIPAASVPVHLSLARANLRHALGREISSLRQINGCCLKQSVVEQGSRCWAATERRCGSARAPCHPARENSRKQ